MATLPLPETHLPALAGLLQGDLWQRWARDGRVFALTDVRAAVRYVRVKPGVSCRLAVFGDHEAGDGPPPGFLLLLFPDAERARTAFAKESSRVHLLEEGGLRPFLSEDPPAVAIPFPNDPDVPALRRIYEPRRLRRVLAQLLEDELESRWRIKTRGMNRELLAYKPGRRAVFRVGLKLREKEGDGKETRELHVKVADPGTIQSSHSRLEAVRSAARGVAVPQPLGVTENGCMSVCEWMPGESLRSVASADGDVDRAFREAGRAVAELHGSPAQLEGGPGEIGLEVLGADLGALVPSLSSEVAEVTRLAAAAEAELLDGAAATAHGDLHLDQVLVHDGAAAIVDFDRATRRPPALDLGSLHAHLLECELAPEGFAAFLEGYAALREVVEHDVRRATGVALLRRSFGPFRALREDWPERTERLLRLARDMLGDERLP